MNVVAPGQGRRAWRTFMKQRPLLKTFTFAILHFLTAFVVVYALTGNFAISGAAALIEPVVNTFVFYLHERAWQRLGHRRSTRSHSYGHDLFARFLRRSGPRGASLRR